MRPNREQFSEKVGAKGERGKKEKIEDYFVPSE